MTLGGQEVSIRVLKLWIYPVKGCQGVSVEEANVTATGFEYDRSWCIVDVSGVAASKMEAVSMRKIPAIGQIQVVFKGDNLELSVTDSSVSILHVPLDKRYYLRNEEVLVECAGKSTTTGKGWSFGFIPARSCGKAASKWITTFLNKVIRPDGMRRSGKMAAGEFLLVRSFGSMRLEDYPPIFPIIEKAKVDPHYRRKFARNEKLFADFAPFLLCNEASRVELMGKGQFEDYPIQSFRPSILVDAPGCPFDEETWEEIEISSETSDMRLTLIKPCPRCLVTCRDPKTTEFLFPKEKVKLWKVIRAMFPEKQKDDEWGSWTGPWFGCYFGNGGKTGSLKVGAQIKIIKKSPCNVTPSRSLLSRLQDVPFLSSVIRNQRSALVFLILLLAMLTTRRYVR